LSLKVCVTFNANLLQNGPLVETYSFLNRPRPLHADGLFKITFYDMTDEGYKWIGEWPNPDESIVYPTWALDCKR